MSAPIALRAFSALSRPLVNAFDNTFQAISSGIRSLTDDLFGEIGSRAGKIGDGLLLNPKAGTFNPKTDIVFSPVSHFDTVQKGVHFKVAGVELKALPDNVGGVIFKQVFSSTPKSKANAAIRFATDQLNSNSAFRKQLQGNASRALEFLRTSDLPGAAGKSAEVRFLLKALE